jgi:hypothetical protein
MPFLLKPRACLTAFLFMLSLNATGLPARSQGDPVATIRDQFFKEEFNKVLATYSQLPSDEREIPLVCFFAGQSYFRNHDIEHADELLNKAVSGTLSAPQRERAEAALSKLKTLKELRPPMYHDYTLEGYTIRIFAKDTPWAKSIAAQMPTFLARAKEGFGNANAYIAFYLFEDRQSYDRFFGAWESSNPEVTVHRGTGGRHIVMFCRYFPEGTEIGGKDVNDLYCRILHEYSHALCNTVYGDNFKMPPLFNEGMADYFGWKYKPQGAEIASKRLQAIAAKRAAMPYAVILKSFHDDNYYGYTIADVLINDLLHKQPLSVYGRIIDLARSSNSNFEYALQQVSGLEPRSEYNRIVGAYWKSGIK